MKVLYKVVIDHDVKFDLKEFQRDVAIYLCDPDGWESKGYSFVESENPQVIIHLSSPAGLRAAGCDAKLSCARLGGIKNPPTHMHINAMRWTQGAKASGQDLAGYRQYVISHEMGHVLGYDHATCPAPGAPAPVMLQQTLGLHGCSPNTAVTPSRRFHS